MSTAKAPAAPSGRICEKLAFSPLVGLIILIFEQSLFLNYARQQLSPSRD